MLSFRLLGAAVLVWLAGCSSWIVQTDYNPRANFGSYRSYAWAEPTPDSPEAAFAHSLTEQRIKAQVQQNLAQRGIVPVSGGGTPDFYISYRVVKEQVTDWYPGWGYGWGYYGGPYWDGYGWGPAAWTYTQGTLVLDFVDARTRNVFFRGFASHAIASPESSPKVSSSVEKILSKYPVPMYAAERRPTG
jgi:hypothetical protein